VDYELFVARKVEKYLARIPRGNAERIESAIENIAQDPRPEQCDKLKANKGFKVRVGDYRILYTVDDNERVVRVYRVGDRKDVYR
jgi:mRNA interferase RelE/StbE